MSPIPVPVVNLNTGMLDSTILLEVGHRYIFREQHVDGDTPYEATVEEISPSLRWVKLRHFPGGIYQWRTFGTLVVFEELAALPSPVETVDNAAKFMKAMREGFEQGRATALKEALEGKK